MNTTCANLLSLQAKDLMTSDVVCVHQEMSIKEAALILVEHGICGAPVVDAEGRCIGVFSATDLLRCYSEQKNDRTIPVERELTCPFVRTVRDSHGRETSLCSLPLGVCSIQRHQKDAAGGSIVTCSEPHSVPVEWGVVEVEKLPDDPVQRYMTADPVTVQCDVGIRTAARMMIDAHIHRLIVVDAEHHPVGILSSSDLLAVIAYTNEA
jgi:predicted transcriptional regulator